MGGSKLSEGLGVYRVTHEVLRPKHGSLYQGSGGPSVCIGRYRQSLSHTGLGRWEVCERFVGNRLENTLKGGGAC